MRGRWLTGWTVTGVIATPVFSHATNATAYGIGLGQGLLLFLAGGTLAVTTGARISAGLRGRTPWADAAIAGGAYIASALSFLALIFMPTSDQPRDFPHFALYAAASLLLLGFLFGLGMARYYKRRRPVSIALGLAAATLLAGVLTFILGYLLAGGNVLVVYGIVSSSWKVPIGLLLSGFLGSLLPGAIAESLLGDGPPSNVTTSRPHRHLMHDA